MMSQAVSAEFIAEIAAVCHKRQSLLFAISFDLLSAAEQQGADNISPHRRNPDQALDPRASRHME